MFVTYDMSIPQSAKAEVEAAEDKSQIPEIKLFRKDKDANFPIPSSGNRKFGNRSKIGGKPDFIQPGPKNTNCRHCHKPMTFYAQIDSVNDKFIIDDCGMIYIYYCFNCGNIEAFAQSY